MFISTWHTPQGTDFGFSNTHTPKYYSLYCNGKWKCICGLVNILSFFLGPSLFLQFFVTVLFLLQLLLECFSFRLSSLDISFKRSIIHNSNWKLCGMWCCCVVALPMLICHRLTILLFYIYTFDLNPLRRLFSSEIELASIGLKLLNMLIIVHISSFLILSCRIFTFTHLCTTQNMSR